MFDMTEFKALPIEQKLEQLTAMTAELAALQEETQRKLDSPEAMAFNLAFNEAFLAMIQASSRRNGRLNHQKEAE